MAYASLYEVLRKLLLDLYDSGIQLQDQLTHFSQVSTSENLENIFKDLASQSQDRSSRLDASLQRLGFSLPTKPSRCMEALLHDSGKIIKQDPSFIIDSAMIVMSQKALHYLIAGFGSASSIAKQLNENSVAQNLEVSLQEIKNADEKLTEIAISEINPQAKEDEF